MQPSAKVVSEYRLRYEWVSDRIQDRGECGRCLVVHVEPEVVSYIEEIP